MRFRVLGTIASAIFLASISVAQTKPDNGNYSAITAGRLRAHLEFIANDLLEGRDTPSRGLSIASEYLASQLKLWGVQPGGPGGSYFQTFPIGNTKLDGDKSIATFNSVSYAAFQGFIPQFSKGRASASLVYVGHGFRIPGRSVDPYKGVDVRGKILVRLNSQPKEWNWQEFFEGKMPGAQTAEQAALAMGAVGIVVIPDEVSATNWDRNAKSMKEATLMVNAGGNMGPAIPIVTASPGMVRNIFADESVTYDQLSERIKKGEPGDSFALKTERALTLEVVQKDQVEQVRNVVGIIRGSDPKLNAEYVAIGAHYDHVGKRDGEGDTIYNGADDDGSGTVSILELAHALATGPKPKRSILFVWHAGEEKGLWGSDFFTRNPTVPIKSIVAQLNVDMIGRSKKAGDADPRNKMLTGPDSIYVIGSRRLSTELGDLCQRVNAALFKLGFDYHYDQPNDPENLYERSDHFNYARYGIPIAFFFDGVHEDYHQVGDQVEKIDFRKMARVSQTICGIAWKLANQANRPKVDKKPTSRPSPVAEGRSASKAS